MDETPKFSAARAGETLHLLAPPGPVRGPDIHRVACGKTEMILISDGTMALPFRALAPEAPLPELCAALGLKEAPALAAGEVICALIRQGDALVLIDTGAGPDWQPGTGRLARHLAALGLDPLAVTHVVLTHLHPDHAWGVLDAKGELTFPKARYFAGRTEVGFWGDRGLAERLSPSAAVAVTGAQRVLDALGDRLTLVQEGDAVIPGLAVLDTPGHTPGHLSLILSEGPGVVITADTAVSDAISLGHPDWPFAFDMMPEAAIQARRRMLDLAVAGGHLIFGNHWAWPGIGRLDRAGSAYRLAPE